MNISIDETTATIEVDSNEDNLYDMVLDVADVIRKNITVLQFVITVNSEPNTIKLRSLLDFIQFLDQYHQNIQVNMGVVDNAGLF